MVTKVGLPENRNRLRSAGAQKAQNSSFDDGYAAGFKAGLEYNLRKTKENIMPTPEGQLTTSQLWSEKPQEEVAPVVEEEQEDDLPKL
jgi:hypothetical protein